MIDMEQEGGMMATNNYLRVVRPRMELTQSKETPRSRELGLVFFDDRDPGSCRSAIDQARDLATGRRDRIVAYRGTAARVGEELRFSVGGYEVNGLIGHMSAR